MVCEEREQPDWIVRRLIPMECSRLQGFPDGWAEIESLKNPKEFNFWREVYARSCEIKKTKPKQTILRADGAKSDEALMRWHDGLHSLAAEYAMWGNGMALPNALFFIQNAFRELGKPPHEVKLGSLFDGSGTMPLCAAMCGGHPVWASEVEPYPIAVTRTHLPHMKHLGSVTEIKGSKIEPVDIITFGSPCQDLSIAGKRAGLKGERSGLFREAIRIIREMLAATNGRYPRFVIWENVPGALSSNGGEDFEVVLFIAGYVAGSKEIDELSFRQRVDENYKETYHLHDLLTEYHKKLWWYITQCDYNLYFHNGKVYTKYTDIFTEGKE